MERNEKEILGIIKELEKLASDVLALKIESIPRRPIVMEFCGSPKSGKSSCINSLDLFLRRNGFRTRVLTERASVCPVRDKYDPNFNIWTACSAIAELSEVIANNSKDYDVVIMDRGIFDALCWFTWLKDNSSFDLTDFDNTKTFLLMGKWRSILDLVYVFTARPEISLKREYANLLTRKTGSIMREDMLNSYRTCVELAASTYSSQFQCINVYDTSDLRLDEVNYQITKKTLETVRENIAEKIGFMPRNSLDNSLPEAFRMASTKLMAIPLEYGLRDNVEQNDAGVQPIPILVITNKERNKVFVVKKNKKRTSSGSPESGKTLVYIGGHIRKEDELGVLEPSLMATAKMALMREVKEETGINYIPSDSDPLCIWVRDGDRSKKHMAICYLFEVDFDAMKFRLDTNEFMSGGNTISGSIASIDKLAEKFNELESWSKIILREFFSVNPSDIRQLPLA